MYIVYVYTTCVYVYFYVLFFLSTLDADNVKVHRSGSRVRAQSSLPTVMVFFRRLIVARTVAAVPVERAQQPPAMVFLQVLDLHFQMPPATRFTFSLPQKLHMYLARCWISYLFTILRRDAP